MTNDSTIISIQLGGFEVFDELVSIPLARLTFLYGPNSAGKSAIEDALKLLTELFNHSGTNFYCEWADYAALRTNDPIVYAAQMFLGFPTPDRFKRLKPYWRRLGEGVNQYAPKLQIGFTGVIATCLEGALHSRVHDDDYPCKHNGLYAESELLSKDYDGETEFSVLHEFRWFVDEDDTNEVQPHCDTTLSVNGFPAIRIIENQKLGLCLKHRVFSYVDWQCDIQKLHEVYPSDIGLSNGWLWINAEGVGGRTALDVSRCGGLFGRLPQLSSFVFRLKQVYDELFKIALGNLDFSKTSPFLVPASRVIPTKSDLTFVQDYSDRDSSENPLALPSRLHDFNLVEDTDFQYGASESINHIFTEYLFVERGYEVVNETLDLIKSSVKLGQLSRIFLKDSAGREFSFEQVGSGLGYVYPVVCAICSDAPMVLLQQPELHLHPALQANLGDAFLERSSKLRSVVIETHSEYILLRVLKRIRQTMSGVKLAEELKVKPEEVALLYFEPTPAGASKVRHIRISDDGDFLDRWPRGFFAERDMELFDE